MNKDQRNQKIDVRYNLIIIKLSKGGRGLKVKKEFMLVLSGHIITFECLNHFTIT